MSPSGLLANGYSGADDEKIILGKFIRAGQTEYIHSKPEHRGEIRKKTPAVDRNDERSLLETLGLVVSMPVAEKSPHLKPPPQDSLNAMFSVLPDEEGPGGRDGIIEKFNAPGKPGVNIQLSELDRAAQAPVSMGSLGLTENADNCAVATMPLAESGKKTVRILHIPFTIGLESLLKNRPFFS